MRAAKDPAYSQFLLDLGDGLVETCPDVGLNAMRVPEAILADKDDTSTTLAAWVFEDAVRAGLACTLRYPSQNVVDF